MVTRELGISIKELIDYERSMTWIHEYFLAVGFKCPKYGAPVEQTPDFLPTERSQMTLYRCRVYEINNNL